jgi:hypothetical protein
VEKSPPTIIAGCKRFETINGFGRRQQSLDTLGQAQINRASCEPAAIWAVGERNHNNIGISIARHSATPDAPAAAFQQQPESTGKR